MNDGIVVKDSRVNTITMEPPFYSSLVKPNGFLLSSAECQALWHYFITASTNFDRQKDIIVYEGSADPVFNYKQLFKSVALMYGADVNTMANHWANVDMQATVMGFPKMPNGYRFENQKVELITNV